jgi:hypothetical protein
MKTTYKPVSTAYNAGTASPMISEYEHVEIALLDNDEHIHPVPCLGLLLRGFPILLAA